MSQETAPPPRPPQLTVLPEIFSRLMLHRLQGYSFPANIPAQYREAIVSELKDLESLESLNAKAARRDNLRFWSLKIPAILASSCAGVFGYFDLQAATIVSGAIGSVCVLIDGLNPGGALRNAHTRAVHDLRLLQRQIKTKLRFVNPGQDSLEDTFGYVKQLILSEQRRIGEYIREAESALGGGAKK